jgi:MFS family permease
MAALDSTIIATLVTPISASFSSFTALSWLASAYLIANAACQPLSGRLTDLFSRRSGLLFSNIFFGFGTLICGLSTSQGMIIAGRVIAGMGGGGLGAISTFVASDLIPLRRRGLWQGIGNIFWGLGSGIGGLFGGWVNDVWGWRWAFIIQIPFICISILLVFFKVKVPVTRTETFPIKRVDFLGAFTLVSALVLLLFGLNAGGNTVPWTHPLVLITLPFSALLFGVFIYVEENIASTAL